MKISNVWEKCKFMVTGDPGQVDLPRRTISGLKALLILKILRGLELYILMIKIYVRHRLVKKSHRCI
jgi:phosphate starvation-inducible PhoH-like protein